MTAMTDVREDAAMDALLARVLPLVDPPAGALPDPDLLCALVEGRLPPSTAARLTRQIAASPAARAELRDLFPEQFEALLAPADAPPAITPARVAVIEPARWRAPLTGLATLIAAAALAFLFVPPSPPQGSGLSYTRDDSANAVRGAVAPGQRFAVRVRVGAVNRFDALRGHAPWAALVVTDPDGVTRVLCTTTDRQRCTAAEGTLGYLFVAPSARGEYRLSLLSGPTAIEHAALTEGAAARPDDPVAALRAVAEAHDGALVEAPPIRVE